MRDMTDAEMKAWDGLTAGNLDPLADVLSDELDVESGQLHPILQRCLPALIRGSPNNTDYRLAVIRHPDLARASDGPRAKRIASSAMLHTALAVEKNGGLKKNQWEAAISATVTETGLSRATVVNHWSSHKKFLLFCKAHGMRKE